MFITTTYQLPHSNVTDLIKSITGIKSHNILALTKLVYNYSQIKRNDNRRSFHKVCQLSVLDIHECLYECLAVPDHLSVDSSACS
jgi:hypothetical protein